MSDIPNDIMKIALEADAEFWGQDGPSGTENTVSFYVARAVFAERERFRQLLSEAEAREREARAKLQAMHRRTQESERVEQMIFDTLGMWYKLFQEGRFKPRAKRGLFFAVMKDLKTKSEKIREARSALQSEER